MDVTDFFKLHRKDVICNNKSSKLYKHWRTSRHSMEHHSMEMEDSIDYMPSRQHVQHLYDLYTSELDFFGTMPSDARNEHWGCFSEAMDPEFFFPPHLPPLQLRSLRPN
jgi:hypothetical protein